MQRNACNLYGTPCHNYSCQLPLACLHANIRAIAYACAHDTHIVAAHLSIHNHVWQIVYPAERTAWRRRCCSHAACMLLWEVSNCTMHATVRIM
jgi:hypothetical protein